MTQLPFDTALLINSAILKFGAGYPPEVAIYVHGFNRNDAKAKKNLIEYKHHWTIVIIEYLLLDSVGIKN